MLMFYLPMGWTRFVYFFFFFLILDYVLSIDFWFTMFTYFLFFFLHDILRLMLLVLRRSMVLKKAFLYLPWRLLMIIWFPMKTV
jgi:hypothetical protein